MHFQDCCLYGCTLRIVYNTWCLKNFFCHFFSAMAHPVFGGGYFHTVRNLWKFLHHKLGHLVVWQQSNVKTQNKCNVHLPDTLIQSNLQYSAFKLYMFSYLCGKISHDLGVPSTKFCQEYFLNQYSVTRVAAGP